MLGKSYRVVELDVREHHIGCQIRNQDNPSFVKNRMFWQLYLKCLFLEKSLGQPTNQDSCHLLLDILPQCWYGIQNLHTELEKKEKRKKKNQLYQKA